MPPDQSAITNLPGCALSRVLASLDCASLRALRCCSSEARALADGAFAKATVGAGGGRAGDGGGGGRGGSSGDVWAAERRYPRLRALRVVAHPHGAAGGGGPPSSAEQRLLCFFGAEQEGAASGDDDDNNSTTPPPWQGRLRELDLSCAVAHLSTPGAASALAQAVARLFPRLVSLALPPVLPAGAPARAVAREQAAVLSHLAALPRLARLRARGWWPLRDALVLARLDALPALVALDLGQGDPAAAACARAGEPLARFGLLASLPRLRRRLRCLRLGGGGTARMSEEVLSVLLAAAPPPEQPLAEGGTEDGAGADDEQQQQQSDAASTAAAAAAAAASAAAAFALAPNIRSLTVAPLPAPYGARRRYDGRSGATVARRALRGGGSGGDNGGSNGGSNGSSSNGGGNGGTWPASEVNAAVAALAPLTRLRHLKLLWLDEEGDDDEDDEDDEEEDEAGGTERRRRRRRRRGVVAPPLEEKAVAARRLDSHALLCGVEDDSIEDQEAASASTAAAAAAGAAAAAAAAAIAAAAAAGDHPPLPLTPETLDLRPLAFLRSLAAVSVGGVVLSDGCVAALARLPALSSLKCRGVSVCGRDPALALAAAAPAAAAPYSHLCCPALVYLEVRGGCFEVGRGARDDAGPAGLPPPSCADLFPALRSLRLRAATATAPPDLRSLAGHPNLRSLELEAASPHWDLNAALAAPSGDSSSGGGAPPPGHPFSLPALRRLRLACHLASELRQWRPPRAAAALPQVQELEIAGAASDGTLAALPRLFPCLVHLRLEGARFATDAGLRRLLSSSPVDLSLRELELVRCPRVSEYGLGLVFFLSAADGGEEGGGGGGRGEGSERGGVVVRVSDCALLGEAACARVRRGVLLNDDDDGQRRGDLVWSPPTGGGEGSRAASAGRAGDLI